MADSGWDNGGVSMPKKSGMPLWAKITMGCGIIALLGLVTCVAGVATCGKAIGKAMNGPEWGQLRAAVEQLGTDDGAKALFQANPELKSSYPTEDSFVEAAKGWRLKLEPLPPQMPSVLSGKISYNVSVSGGFRKVELGYTNGKGGKVASRWENGRLEMISVD